MLFSIDTSLVVYLSLFVLFIWRLFFAWHCFGKWLQFANYCVLLYAVLTGSLLFDCLSFMHAALGSGAAGVWQETCWWVKPFMLTSFFAMWVTLFMCAGQTVQHIDAIRRGEAALRHDRVVQILALPVVYGSMAVASGTRMFQLAAVHGKDVMKLEDVDVASEQLISSSYAGSFNVQALTQTALAKSETAFMVADLYEAWVLYQFLTLTLDLMYTSMQKKCDSEDVETRAGARALVKVHAAVSSLSWLGPCCFLLVCVGQAGWSIYILNFAYEKSTWSSWMGAMAQFQAAGFLASMAAIWNVAVVETSFHDFLEGYSPMLKFITVKILVSFSFFQRSGFSFLSYFASTMPSAMEGLVHALPFLGDVVQMGVVEFELFYAALLMYECTLVALMHWCAWAPAEQWYKEDASDVLADAERLPLVGKGQQKLLGHS